MLTFPVGLLGLLIIMAFVFGEKALLSSSISNAQPLEVSGYRPSPLSYLKNNNYNNPLLASLLTALGDGLRGTKTGLPPAMQTIGL